jgi:hypothetical protein
MEQQPTLNDMMNAYALDAVDYAREKFQVELDFSEASIQQVEKILGQLHESLPKGLMSKLLKKQPSEQEMDALTKMFGGYIAGVMQRLYGGDWKAESQAFPGQEVLTFEVKGRDLWPQFKVGKRIMNGAEDNVWHYYQVVKVKFTQA